MYVLSLSLFCQASEKVANKPNKLVKSLMDEYHDFFKLQLKTENRKHNSLAKDVDVVKNNQQERRFGRGSSGPGEGQVDLDMDLNLLLKMTPCERDVRLAKYKKDAFKLLEQDRELFIKSLDAEQRQRFQDIEEKTEKIQYVCKQEEKNIRYLVMQRRQESKL
jgi:hypothetical protein